MRPSTTEQDTGLNCWREPGEPRDGKRFALLIREFWDSPEEAAAYLSTVRGHPQIVDTDADTIESGTTYIQRIAEIVAKMRLPKPAKRFPPRHWMAQEYTGPREPIQEHGLTFEDRTDAIYDRQPGEEG